MSPPNTDPKPLGYLRDPSTGGLVTVANVASDARLAPAEPKPWTMPPAVAGVLGLLALLAGVPGAILVALPATVTAPAWLPVAAVVGGVLTPFFTGAAFWAQGGNPLDLVTRFAPKAPPASSAPKVGPPEP